MQGFEDWQDPRSTGGTSGLAITSDWLTRPLELKSDARYVVVVEKDGVFNRLVEDGFFDRRGDDPTSKRYISVEEEAKNQPTIYSSLPLTRGVSLSR